MLKEEKPMPSKKDELIVENLILLHDGARGKPIYARDVWCPFECFPLLHDAHMWPTTRLRLERGLREERKWSLREKRKAARRARKKEQRKERRARKWSRQSDPDRHRTPKRRGR